MLKKKYDNLSFLYSALFIITFLPLIGAWFPFFSRTWIFYLLGCVLSVRLVPQFYSSNIFKMLVIYSLVVVVKSLAGNAYFSSVTMAVSTSAEMVFSMSVMYYVFKTEDKKLIGQLSVFSMIVFAVLAVGTYLAEQSFPGAVRYVAHQVSVGESDELGRSLMRLGMTEYSLPHALPILMPPLVGSIRNRELAKKYKVMCFVILLMCISIILFSGAATPMMLTIALILLASFVPPNSKQRSAFIVFTIIVGGFILFKQEIGGLMMSAGDNSMEGAGMTISNRVSEIGTYLVTGEEGEDIEGRKGHYESTTSRMFENVIWGTDKAGGHSAILDRFTLLGFLGFIPWILAITWGIKMNYRLFRNKKSASFFIAGVIGAFIMLLSKNMASFTMWFTLFVLLPIFTRFCDADKQFKLFR